MRCAPISRTRAISMSCVSGDAALVEHPCGTCPLPRDVVVARLRVLVVLGSVEAVVPPTVTQIVGQVEADFGDHLLPRRSPVGRLGKRPVEVEDDRLHDGSVRPRPPRGSRERARGRCCRRQRGCSALIARTEHEGRAELRHALARLVDARAALPGLDRCRPRARVQEPVPRRDLDRRRVRGLGVVVDQHEERNLLVLHERTRVALVAGADRNEIDALVLQIVVTVAQLTAWSRQLWHPKCRRNTTMTGLSCQRSPSRCSSPFWSGSEMAESAFRSIDSAYPRPRSRRRPPGAVEQCPLRVEQSSRAEPGGQPRRGRPCS